MSYFFQLHSMLYAYVRRFDVMSTVENFWELNTPEVARLMILSIRISGGISYFDNIQLNVVLTMG